MKSLLSIFFMFAVNTAYACKCSEEIIKTYFSKADRVFIGTVMSEQKMDETVMLYKSELNVVRAKFKLISLYKGTGEELLQVLTDTSTCGLDFETGKKYLIFDKPGRVVEWCNGSRRLSAWIDAEEARQWAAKKESEAVEQLKALTMSSKTTN